MTLKIVSPGGISAAIVTPLPVTVQGGEVRIAEGVPLATVWSGPWGLRAPYPRANMRQVTSQNPGNTWVDGDGGVASDEAFAAGEWTAAQKLRFATEFADARPGILYGMLFQSKGSAGNAVNLEDMYSSSQSSITVRRNRRASDYQGNYFSMRQLLALWVAGGGLWMITFPKPIQFHLGLRAAWDNGQGWYYFLYSLDPSFA